MTSTGVPPLTLVMQDLHHVKGHIQRNVDFRDDVVEMISELRQELPESVAGAVRGTIDDRAHELGSITMPALTGKMDAMAQQLQASIVDLLQERFPANGAPPTSVEEDYSSLQITIQSPNSFNLNFNSYFFFKDLMLHQAFDLWYRG
eukprot:m.384848 g.384848  ORF g.384848 m.384848 type:complete len:147 (+) comp16736_c0_seq5:694-1134(+)